MFKIALLSISIIGSLFFGALFGFTFGVPQSVERVGQNFIKMQIEKEFSERSNEFSKNIIGEKYTEKLKYLKKKYQKEIDTAQSQLDAKVPEMVASVIASMCKT